MLFIILLRDGSKQAIACHDEIAKAAGTGNHTARNLRQEINDSENKLFDEQEV